MTKWLEHVKAFQKKNGCTYKEAMTRAKQTYGGSLKSNYIKRLVATGNFDINKIINPSQHLINKYRKKVIPSSLTKRTKHKKSAGQIKEDSEHEEIPYEAPYEAPYEPEPEREPEYEDFGVSSLAEFRANKKKRTKLTKAERDAMKKEEEEIEKDKQEVEEYTKLYETQKQKSDELLTYYHQLKADIIQFSKTASKIEDAYRKQLQQIKSSKTIKKIKKDEMIEKLATETNENNKAVRVQYKTLFEYVKKLFPSQLRNKSTNIIDDLLNKTHAVLRYKESEEKDKLFLIKNLYLEHKENTKSKEALRQLNHIEYDEAKKGRLNNFDNDMGMTRGENIAQTRHRFHEDIRMNEKSIADKMRKINKK
jgi:hypothetical protein